MQSIIQKTISTTLVVLTSVNLSGCETVVPMKSCTKLIGTSEYLSCAASAGDQESQFQLGIQYYDAGDISSAIKWLEYAAKVTHEKRLVYVEQGEGNFTMRDERTGNIIAGHTGAQRLLKKISEEASEC